MNFDFLKKCKSGYSNPFFYIEIPEMDLVRMASTLKWKLDMLMASYPYTVRLLDSYSFKTTFTLTIASDRESQENLQSIFDVLDLDFNV